MNLILHNFLLEVVKAANIFVVRKRYFQVFRRRTTPKRCKILKPDTWNLYFATLNYQRAFCPSGANFPKCSLGKNIGPYR